MFGYIIVNKQELKFREFDVYQSYYCGLCQSLKERFGRRGQLTLSYDMTFVALLLSALYDEPVENSTCKCDESERVYRLRGGYESIIVLL